MKNCHNVCEKKGFKGLKKGRSAGNEAQNKRIRDVIPKKTGFFFKFLAWGLGSNIISKVWGTLVFSLLASETGFKGLKPIPQLLGKCCFSPSHAKVVQNRVWGRG